MNIFHTSVAISQLKCLDYAFFVAKMSKMTFTRFGGQVWLDGGQVRQFWGRACMGYHVFFEGTSLCVGLVTLRAIKRLFSTVNQHVFFQMIIFGG